MQILEHQILTLNNIIRYRTSSDMERIPEMIGYFSSGARHLGAEPTDKIVIADNGSDEYEFLIPVDRIIGLCFEAIYLIRGISVISKDAIL